MDDKNKPAAGSAGGDPGESGPPFGSMEEHAENPRERSEQRRQEDENFTPVIVKRVDQHRRHPDDVLVSAIAEGLEQLNRPALSLGLSSIAAGLILGFTAMAVGVATVTVEPFEFLPALSRMLVSLVYPLGFVICLMSGAELFTEHTATAVYPVLDRKAGISRLLRLWCIVIVGNLIGAGMSAGLLTLAEPVIGARAGYIEIGHHLVEPSSFVLVVSAVLAGWLMALGGWLMLANPAGLSQIVSIFIVTFLIGMGGLHHSIAGSVEMFAALLASSEFTVGQAARFIGLALAGNLVGGSLFVAVLNYAHIRETRRSE
ncbi:MAG: formate/nitrite transporter family protein [Candidatus Sulfomarinibacteraceae bacterium]